MKKYMIAAIALLLATGAINAQATPQHASKTTAANPVAHSTKPSSPDSKNVNASASVSPASTKATTNNSEIKRKHHHKNTKTASTAPKK